MSSAASQVDQYGSDHKYTVTALTCLSVLQRTFQVILLHVVLANNGLQAKNTAVTLEQSKFCVQTLMSCYSSQTIMYMYWSLK